MPRKKRTRRRDDDDGAFPSKRRHTENTEPLVISDSETEEEEYKPTAREGRLRGRESRAPDRGLTEEEMMAWALRMSETEEGNAAQRRRQQEEEDMRLAIEQSLNANGMQTYGDPCESSSLAMTPVAESPARPPRQTPCSLSRSKRKRDVSAEDQFTTTTAVGVAQSRKPSDPLSQPAAPSEAPPLSKDAPVPALPPSEEVGPFHGRVLVSDSDRESQDSSVVLCSQAGGSPVFPQSPSQRAVLCLEKLSQAQEQDCRSAGFVLCSQSDPAPSPRLRPLSDGPCPKAALNSPETLPSTPSPPRPPPPSRPSVSERTSNPEPSNQRGGQREDANGDEGGRGRTQGLGRGAGRSRQTTLGVCVSVSERVAGSVLRGAVQPEQDFHTQMNLHWSDGEDDGEELIPAQGKEECPIVTQTLSPPRSQNAVCEQSSPSDSESLLRVVPSSVRSLVFSQDAVGLRAQTSGPAQNPPSPPGSRSPLIGCGAGAGGARGPRWKFTFRNMYTAPSAAASCSGGRGPTASPSLPGQATPPNTQRRAGPVLYYWGVPFCPRGQNPDTYTQVILSQLEVYEKSLKSAQRGLLRKAAWGEPLLPAPLKRPFSRRARLKRSRPARPIRTEEEEEQEEEEDPGEAPAEEEEEEEERGGSQRGVGPSGGAQDSEAFTAPSQSLLEQKSPLPEEPPEKFPFLRRRALRDRSPAESETQLLEEEEEEEGMCPETQLSEQNSQDVNMDSPAGSQPRPGSEVMEVQEEEEEQGSMEVDQAEEVQVCGERVECPICMRPFPLPQIEMHAAYCDGSAQPSTPDDSSPVMVLRKSARRPETTEEDQPGSSKATQEPSPEKCFLCQGQFPVKEYRSHVDACLRLKSHPTQGAKSLLTALERSEQKESEAGPSQEHSFSHAAPANADQSGDSGGVAFAVSNSPIKSFTPISQATDCLVDFKRQYSAKPSQRAGRKRKHR